MNIKTILEELFSKIVKKHILVTKIPGELPQHHLKWLGLRKSEKLTSVIIKALGDPPPGFGYLKYRNSQVLVQGKPDDLLLDKVNKTPGQTIGQLARALPLAKDNLRDLANRLLEQGILSARISSSDLVQLHPGMTPAAPAASEETKSPAIPENIQDRVDAFKKAHDQVSRGKYYVYIYKIRRLLDWPREVFDELMDHLMVEGYVLANPGNPAELTDDQVKDCYHDNFGDLYITVNWRGGA